MNPVSTSPQQPLQCILCDDVCRVIVVYIPFPCRLATVAIASHYWRSLVLEESEEDFSQLLKRRFPLTFRAHCSEGDRSLASGGVNAALQFFALYRLPMEEAVVGGTEVKVPANSGKVASFFGQATQQIVRWLSPKPESRIFMFGAPSSGVSSTIRAIAERGIGVNLKTAKISVSTPCVGQTIERLAAGTFEISAMSVDPRNFRRVLYNTGPFAAAIIVVVDGSLPRQLLPKQRDSYYTAFSNESFVSWDASITPFLFLVNKHDLRGQSSFITTEELARKWELLASVDQGRGCCRIQYCSAMSGEGISEGWRWLMYAVQYLAARKK